MTSALVLLLLHRQPSAAVFSGFVQTAGLRSEAASHSRSAVAQNQLNGTIPSCNKLGTGWNLEKKKRGSENPRTKTQTLII